MKNIKKTGLSVLAALAATLMLAACGSTASSQQGSSVPSSKAESVVSAPAGSSTAQPSKDGLDLPATAEALAQAANLGVTIKLIEIDLSAGGIDTANIEEFAGLQSQNVAENGGVVILVRAKDGKAEEVATQLEAYRDFQTGNEDYAEFETARTNIKDARIKVFGNYVLYAVSATGHEGGWDQLDKAIDEAFK